MKPLKSEPDYHAAMTPLDDQEVHRLSGPAIRIFLKIALAWGLSAEEQRQLLGVEQATLEQWQVAQDGTLSPEQLERVSCCIGIYKSLQILLPASADGWVRRPNTNPLFQGQPAIQLMTQGGIAGLRKVRSHLLAKEGGWA